MNAAALVLLSALRFVNPLNGSQAVGAQWIEVTTDATNVDRVDFIVDGVLAGVARKAPWRIAHDFGTSLETHTISAKLWTNGYRATDVASIKTATLTAADSMNVDLVEVPMRIRSDNIVKPKDVKLKENGVVQDIRDIKAERGAAHFVFVVDRSLSMGEGKLTAVLHAIDANMHLLRLDDTASIVLFNHNVALPRPVARTDKTAEIFGDIVPSGGTSLFDALASIVSNDRTYAIVISDGDDRNSELSSDEALRRISNTNMMVESITLHQ